MSYNIIEDSNEILVEGINFICFSYPTYDSEGFIDLKTQDRYSIEMIEKSIKQFVPVEDFLKMVIFDYIIGNTDRHQSNWALISGGERWRWSPLYDNSSSLCAYISEEQIPSYLGRDKNRWNALVDTKSKSLIRCTVSDQKRPTHLTVLGYIKNNYWAETEQFVRTILTRLTEAEICDILNQYSDTELTYNKKILIKNFLISKVQMLKEIYFGKEERHVD